MGNCLNKEKTIKKLNTYENNIIASQNNIFNIYELKG